jgi:4-carboxymuconolactone decarboxylase
MSHSAQVEKLLERLTEVSEEGSGGAGETSNLDPRTRALVSIGAAACTNAPTSTFQTLVASAIEAGATAGEVLGVMLAIAPAAGESRIVTIAPKVALALGYDVDAAFEHE